MWSSSVLVILLIVKLRPRLRRDHLRSHLCSSRRRSRTLGIRRRRHLSRRRGRRDSFF